MPVVDRAALEDSPLADLHALASELGIDGFRRLRKADLVEAILTRQGGDAAPAAEPRADADDEEEERPRRGRRGGRGGRGRSRKDADEAGEDAAEASPAEASAADAEPSEQIAEGVDELLGNVSGFLRVAPPDPSDDDVYIS